MDGQMTFILDGRAEEKKTSAFTFSQEIIDAVLANGSGFSEQKVSKITRVVKHRR